MTHPRAGPAGVVGRFVLVDERGLDLHTDDALVGLAHQSLEVPAHRDLDGRVLGDGPPVPVVLDLELVALLDLLNWQWIFPILVYFPY